MMYDQFVPREFSGAMFDTPGNTNYQESHQKLKVQCYL
jgi:hypothetical protein